MGRPWIIAHNGGLETSAAGSLGSFAAAVSSGCDGIELDVRRLGDGTLVVAHDATVRDVRLSDLDVGALRRLEGRPPLLEEVLELFGDSQVCNLELKESGYVEEVLALAKGFVREELLLLSSFSDTIVTAIRQLSSGVRTGLVVSRSGDPVPSRRDLGARVGATGVDFVCVRASLIAHGVLEHAVALSVPALVWTVNDAAQLAELLSDERVTGVFTDFPVRALEVRRALQTWR